MLILQNNCFTNRYINRLYLLLHVILASIHVLQPKYLLWTIKWICWKGRMGHCCLIWPRHKKKCNKSEWDAWSPIWGLTKILITCSVFYSFMSIHSLHTATAGTYMVVSVSVPGHWAAWGAGEEGAECPRCLRSAFEGTLGTEDPGLLAFVSSRAWAVEGCCSAGFTCVTT